MNKPQIRFKGFEEEWKRQLLSETFTFLKNNTLSRAYLVYSHQKVKNVHYGDILIKFGSTLDYYDNQLPFILDGFEPELNNQSLLQNGDIIIADTAEDEAVGKCVEIQGIDDEKIVSGLHTIPMRPNYNFAPNYLGYFVNANAFHKTLYPLMQGIKVLSISKGSISLTNISYPIVDEQAQIGNYFKRIDEMIREVEREISRLEKMKQASLQKMFPRPGETIPEIRFGGFPEPWELKPLEKIVSFSRGQGYTKADLRESGIPIFLYGRLYTQYSPYVESVNTYSFRMPFSVLSRGNEVVMPSSGETAEDIAVASAILSPGIILAGGLNILIPNNEVDSIFMALSLTYGEAHNELAKKAQGKSVVHIYNQDIAELSIFVPSLAEQKAIGEYFRNLDSLLAAKRRKLVKLRNIKKACLDKMFVNSSDI